MGISTGTPCCDPPQLLIGKLATLGLGPAFPQKMCGTGSFASTSTWQPGYQVDGYSSAAFIGKMLGTTSGSMSGTQSNVTVDGGVAISTSSTTFTKTPTVQFSRRLARPSDYSSSPTAFATWPPPLDNPLWTKPTVRLFTSCDVNCDGNLALDLGGFQIGIISSSSGLPNGPMQVKAKGQVLYTFPTTAIIGNLTVEHYLAIGSTGSLHEFEDLFFNGTIIASWNAPSSGVYPHFDPYQAPSFTHYHFRLSDYGNNDPIRTSPSSVSNITHTVGSGETLIKDSFNFTTENSDWTIDSSSGFSFDNTGATATAGYGSDLRNSGVTTESFPLIDGALYRIEFQTNNLDSIPFIAHNNSVFNKGSNGNFNWTFTWGSPEVPYSTGEFRPDDVCGYYFLGQSENTFRFIARINESASVWGLKIYRVDA